MRVTVKMANAANSITVPMRHSTSRGQERRRPSRLPIYSRIVANLLEFLVSRLTRVFRLSRVPIPLDVLAQLAAFPAHLGLGLFLLPVSQRVLLERQLRRVPLLAEPFVGCAGGR